MNKSRKSLVAICALVLAIGLSSCVSRKKCNCPGVQIDVEQNDQSKLS